jgi:hypothetical protein
MSAKIISLLLNEDRAMKILAVLIVVIMSVFLAYTQQSNFDYHSRIGIVERKEDKIYCISIPNNDVAKDETVNLIFTRKPQSTTKAVVVEKLSASCSRTYRSEGGFSFYSLKLGDEVVTRLTKTEDMRGVGIAIIGLSKPIIIKKGTASVDIDGDGSKEYFRQCAGIEGIQFSVWKGIPLKGKRVWSQYFYLGYDVEPNCKDKDFKD